MPGGDSGLTCPFADRNRVNEKRRSEKKKKRHTAYTTMVALFRLEKRTPVYSSVATPGAKVGGGREQERKRISVKKGFLFDRQKGESRGREPEGRGEIKTNTYPLWAPEKQEKTCLPARQS